MYKITYNIIMHSTDDMESAYYEGVQAERERILELIELWLGDDGLEFDDIHPEILNG